MAEIKEISIIENETKDTFKLRAPIYEIDHFHKWWYSIDLHATTCMSFPHWACSINIVCFETEM